MDAGRRAVIDTNLLVRYLTEDEPAKAHSVGRLLEKAGRGEAELLVPSVVIAELVWVLQSFYKLNRGEIVPLLHAIIHTPGVYVNDREIVVEALTLYRQKNIDFIDAWIVGVARSEGINSMYTFDRKHFKDIEGVEIKHP